MWTYFITIINTINMVIGNTSYISIKKEKYLLVLFTVSYLLLTNKALAISPDDDIDTNRPSFTDSALVVPKGSLQLENGLLYQHSQHGSNYFEIPETEVRLGLTPHLEFQMFVPDWAILHTNTTANVTIANSKPTSTSIAGSGGSINGASDLTEVGIKKQFPQYWHNFNSAIVGGVTIPTGSSFISGNGVQPVIRYPWSQTIYGPWSLSGMQSILVVKSGEDVQWQNFWVINRGIGQRTSLFMEYAGFYTHSEAPNNIIHFGIVRKLNKHNQIDLHFGFGLNKTAPAAFIGTGYSFRFDHLPLLD